MKHFLISSVTKTILLLLLIAAALLPLSGCASHRSLPAGIASEVRITNGDSYWNLGGGKFRYLNDTTIEFIRGSDGKTYYLSTATLIDIIVAPDNAQSL